MNIAFISHTWEDPIGLMIMVSCLKESGHDAKLFFNERSLINKVSNYNPDIIGISCITGNHKWANGLAKDFKERGFIVIAGGAHPTFYPDYLVNSFFDAICVGEGEFAIIDIANNGLSPYKKIIGNLTLDLNTLPFPDREHYGRYKFIRQNKHRMFMTSRGCPYGCSFCFNKPLRQIYDIKPVVRKLRPNRVIQELLEVKINHGLDMPRFIDDHFAINQEWLQEFTEIYISEINLPYTCQSRIDSLNEIKIKMLKDSGCRLINFGVETGNDFLRNSVLNKQLDRDIIIENTKLLRKYEIEYCVFNLIGIPGETIENAIETIKFNHEIKATYPWCSFLQFYPGTEIYTYAKNNGYLDLDFSFDNIKPVYFDTIYGLNQDNKNELINIQRFFFLWSKFPKLIAPMRFLIKLKPNIIFKFIFLICYVFIQYKKSRITFKRMFMFGLKFIKLMKG